MAGGIGYELTERFVGGCQVTGAEPPGGFPAQEARQGRMEVSHGMDFGRPSPELRVRLAGQTRLTSCSSCRAPTSGTRSQEPS
jgi:hypothetical protein